MPSAETEDGSSGPRRGLREAQRRSQILSATIELVAELGFESASASAIAERAGLSKGLIWHYFADKVDLMKQAVAHATVTIVTEVAGSIDTDAPAPARVRAYLRALVRARERHPGEFRAMDQITRKLVYPGGTPAFTQADYEELFRGQEALFRQGQQEGSFRAFDTRVMAVTYQGAVDGMLGYLDSHPDADANAHAAELTDILLNAMEKR